MKTPTRDEMITKIYEEMADKTLSFGCIYGTRDKNQRWRDERRYASLASGGGADYGFIASMEERYYRWKIIGHPVMIGDVMKWFIEKFGKYSDDYDMNISHNLIDLIHVWSVFDKPLEEQSDDCIRFIYDLMSGLGK